MILIRRTEVRPFSDKQIELLKTFADQAVIAIENVRLFQELQTRTQELAHSVEQLRSLAEVSQAVNSTLDLEQVLATIVAHAVQLSAADGGVRLRIRTKTSSEFRLRATYGLPEDLVETLLATPLRMGEGATGRAAATRAPVQIPDLRVAGAYSGPLQEVESAGRDACAARGSAAARGTRSRQPRSSRETAAGEFPPEVVDLLQTFAAQSTLAIQNARLFREIEQKSHELRDREPAQVAVPGQHEPRAAHAAQRDPRLHRADRRQIYGEVPEKIRRGARARAEERATSARPDQRRARPVQDRGRAARAVAGRLLLRRGGAERSPAAVGSLAAEKKLQLLVDVPPDLPVGRATSGASRRCC